MMSPRCPSPHTTAQTPAVLNRDESLSHELCVSDMLLSSLDIPKSVTDDENFERQYSYEPRSTQASKKSLEECIQEEGLEYVGGYVVHKFPQDTFLRSNDVNSWNWIQVKSYREGSLVTHSREFCIQLQDMERLFKCYNGEKGLKAGIDAVKILTNEMAKYVTLTRL